MKKKSFESGKQENRKGMLVPAFLLSSLILLVGCAGGLHGTASAGVTGSVLDPSDAQFHADVTTNFAKKPQRTNSSGK